MRPHLRAAHHPVAQYFSPGPLAGLKTCATSSFARRFWALPRRARGVLLLAAALQIGARGALAVASVPRVIAAATRLGAAFSWRGVDAAALQWALAAAAARTGGTCLTQAIAARVISGGSARRSRLVIGVRRTTAPLTRRTTQRPHRPQRILLSTQHLAPNTQHLALNTQHFALNIEHLARGARHLEFHAWTEIDGVRMPRTENASSFVPLAVWS